MNKMLAICFLMFLNCMPRYSVYEPLMYGNSSRTELQKKDDSLFVIEETEKHGTIQNASKYYSEFGWNCLYNSNVGWSIPLYTASHAQAYLNMAMKKMNQAWLMDSLNANAYWGMALIVAVRDNQYEHAEELMEKAIQCDSTNFRMWFDYGLSNLEVIEKAKLKDDTILQKYRKKATIAFQKVLNSNVEAEIKEYAKKIIEDNKLTK